MKWNQHVYMAPADGEGGGAPPPPAPSPAPTPAPSPTPSPAPSPSPTPAPSPSPTPSPSPAPAPADPHAWREQFVGKLADGASEESRKEHEALTNLAKRYTSLPDAAKALRAAQLKFSSGQVVTKLPENATEAQRKEWRAENGIPETPDKYDLKLKPGFVISGEDKQMLTPILAAMHKVDAPPAAVSAGVSAYFEMKEEEIVAAVKLNEDTKKATQIELTELWGPRDLQQNVDGVENLLTEAGQEVSDLLNSASTPEGVLILNHPGFFKLLSKFAREGGYVNATMTEGGDFGAGLVTEMESLKEMLVKDPDKYYGDPKYAKRLSDIQAAQKRKTK